MLNYNKGRSFEIQVKSYFESKYKKPFIKKKILTGFNGGKLREFDLVNEELKILIECKNFSFVNGTNIPPAKISDFLKEIYKLYIAPSEYTKIMCIKLVYSDKLKKTLKEYIVDKYFDFLPESVEIIELD